MQVHYHCWIALPHLQVQTAGFGNTGMISLISELWNELTDDISRVHLAENGRYSIVRGNVSGYVDDCYQRMSKVLTSPYKKLGFEKIL